VQVFAAGAVRVSRNRDRSVSRSLFTLVGAGDLCLMSSVSVV
jgi:hypothetical protein